MAPTILGEQSKSPFQVEVVLGCDDADSYDTRLASWRARVQYPDGICSQGSSTNVLFDKDKEVCGSDDNPTAIDTVMTAHEEVDGSSDHELHHMSHFSIKNMFCTREDKLLLSCPLLMTDYANSKSVLAIFKLIPFMCTCPINSIFLPVCLPDPSTISCVGCTRNAKLMVECAKCVPTFELCVHQNTVSPEVVEVGKSSWPYIALIMVQDRQEMNVLVWLTEHQKCFPESKLVSRQSDSKSPEEIVSQFLQSPRESAGGVKEEATFGHDRHFHHTFELKGMPL
ncbi:hypothetical protein G9A89_001758, partial [Geosiphon pyriformis]